MWFWLALISSIFGALDVILSKKVLYKVSSTVLVWSLYALTLPVVILLALREGFPSLSTLFFLGAFGSSFAFIFSKTIASETLKKNLISKILPLTAFNGVFTYIFALLFLSESIRLVPLLGLFAIVSGSYILNVDQARESWLKPFKLLFLNKISLLYLFAIMLSSIAAIFDKTAINNTNPTSPVFTVLVEQTILVVVLTIYMLKKEAKTWAIELKQNFGMLFLNSLTSLVGILLVFSAYGAGGPVALVIGIRRVQLFLILLMGYLFFKDKPTKHVWIATAIMILGVLMIKLG